MGRHTCRRSTWLWLGIALLLASGGGGALANSSSDSWPPVLLSTEVALPVSSGIEYRHVTLTTANGPLEIHHLHVDLHTPTVRLGVALAHDRLMSEDETVTSMTLRSGAIAGINGDYFDIHQSGTPLNIVIRDGQLLRSPWRWVALALGRDGSVRIIRFRWTGSLTLPETGEVRALDGYNSGLSPDGLVAITDIRGYGAPPPPDAATRQTVVELSPGSELDRYYVKQVWSQKPFYAPFPSDEMLLVGRGRASDWLLDKMTAGTPVQVSLTTDPDWHDFENALGGGPLLIQNGQVVEDPDAPAPQERNHPNPVIAVGIGQDGQTLTFVEVDGRQPELSIGLTRPQLAAYMLKVGAYQAMALDSGGSATMVARLPGQPSPTVVNSPSDGMERPVANAVLVYSTAVPGPPTRLLVNANRPLRLFANARTALSIIGVDAQGTPTSLSEPVQITAPPGLVAVAEDGTVVAGTTAGRGMLRAQSGDAIGVIPVSVTTRLARLLVTPETANVAPGAGWTFHLHGFGPEGSPVILPNGAGWTVKPKWLGIVSPSGEFAASDGPGAGTITAYLGGAEARSRVAVDGMARYVREFDGGAWTFSGYPDSVTGSVGPASTPSHMGRPSAQLVFNLDGTGNRAAYLMTHLPLLGVPTGITLWVHGDGSGVWLRGAYVQSNGNEGTVTLARRVNWRGWRSVTGHLLSPLAYPITWTSLYVVETDPAQSPHGVIYLSSFRATYPTIPQ